MRFADVVLVCVTLMVGRTDEAHACSCLSNAFDLPSTGTTGVPTNLREIYFSKYYAGDGVRLRSADGEELDLGTVQSAPGYGSSLWVASVPTDLRPDTSYVLRNKYVGPFDPALLAFTTGSGPDQLPPPRPRFERFGIDHIGGDLQPCGRETARIHGYVAAPRDKDIATVVVRFVRSDGQREERILPTSPTGTLNLEETVWFPSILGTQDCQVKLELLEDETYRVEAWTIDVAGNQSEVTAKEVLVDAGCATTRPGSLGVIAVLAFALRRHRRRSSARWTEG
ncbi:MAG: hypothetical protein ACKV2T_08530 [Kofleriaceae bacterium]